MPAAYKSESVNKKLVNLFEWKKCVKLFYWPDYDCVNCLNVVLTNIKFWTFLETFGNIFHANFVQIFPGKNLSRVENTAPNKRISALYLA